jgi:hypothetical protein
LPIRNGIGQTIDASRATDRLRANDAFRKTNNFNIVWRRRSPPSAEDKALRYGRYYIRTQAVP